MRKRDQLIPIYYFFLKTDYSGSIVRKSSLGNTVKELFRYAAVISSVHDRVFKGRVYWYTSQNELLQARWVSFSFFSIVVVFTSVAHQGLAHSIKKKSCDTYFISYINMRANNLVRLLDMYCMCQTSFFLWVCLAHEVFHCLSRRLFSSLFLDVTIFNSFSLPRHRSPL
uniref:Uncharacterized protein n=1 Tax=Rhipicephalus microplus TaxID=6941 RepID=A0A6G5A2U8_RHIMP